jgi:ribosome maturation factor RimP
METERSSLWDIVRGVAADEGVELFDIDAPSEAGRGGVLRVFITRERTEAQKKATEIIEADADDMVDRGGISFEDCVRVSKRLLDIDEKEPLIPENCTLEVSSPGINRRLRRPEHFAGAVGERVRVKFRDQTTGVTQVLCGRVVEASDRGFALEGEAKKERISIGFNELKEARVDFKF